MTRIKIGIIGAGYIAGVHAGILANDERVSLTAVHDVLPECADRIARSSKADVVSAPEDVISSCDAIYITTPNTKHVPLAIAAASAGKRVFARNRWLRLLLMLSRLLKQPTKAREFFRSGITGELLPSIRP